MKQYNLAFDIGGYNGGYTAWLLQHYKRIITVEPNPASFKLLQNRFQNEERVVLKNCAISNKSIPHIFYISSRHPTLCTLSNKFISQSRFTNNADENNIKYEWDQEITVDCLTLKELITRFGIPDLIKIDVEGHELDVLRTLPQLNIIPKTIDITFEVTEEFIEDTERCCAVLATRGFTEFGLIDNDRPESYPTKFFTYDEFMKTLEIAFPSKTKNFFGMAFARTSTI